MTAANRQQEFNRRVLIVGAGEAGEMVLEEIENSSRLNRKIIGFVDDDPDKDVVKNYPVLGTTGEIGPLCEDKNIGEVIIAMPSAGGDTIRSITRQADQMNAHLRIVPGIREIIEGEVHWSQVRNIKPADLLGRETVELDREKIRDFLKNKTVLVTGAAGSIGSELVQYLVEFPGVEVAGVDINESALYELSVSRLKTDLQSRFNYHLGDIRDKSRLAELFSLVKPDLVLHAAALKHVPVVEKNPVEGLKTNISGTINLLELIKEYRVPDCLVISTDKAVKPRGIMGMTKRVTERLAATYQQLAPATRFASVRFGNVLGSRGSVVPLFKKQIEQGGPVTVTDPEVVRYFMTPTEAVKLVMQAASLEGKAPLYVLDMGDPIKILDLARQLIALSGYQPDSEIPIEITGLRPGEKLEEVLVGGSEEPRPTSHSRIRQLNPPGFSAGKLENLKKLLASPPQSRQAVTGELEEFV